MQPQSPYSPSPNQPSPNQPSPAQARPPVGSTAGPQSEVLYEGVAKHSVSIPGYAKWVMVSVLGGLAAFGLGKISFFSSWPLWVLGLALELTSTVDGAALTAVFIASGLFGGYFTSREAVDSVRNGRFEIVTAGQLGLHGLDVVLIDVGVPERVDELADRQPTQFSQQVGERGVARDVERDAEEDVSAALVELAA